MKIQHFFDEPTSTLSYVVHDEARKVGVVIDPIRDFDPKSGRTSWRSAEAMARYVDAQGIALPYVVDTHAHADHLSGLPFFKSRYGAKTVTGKDVGIVQRAFRDIYDLGPDFPVDGRQFDILLDEGEELEMGGLRLHAIHTPGHTPAHMSWQIGDAIFVGDTIFAPDYGTARCDFPGGDAGILYDSIQRLYALPDDTRLFLCHDYRPGGRPLRFETTVAEHKASNVHLRAGTARDEFIEFRTKRDAQLDMPVLILPSVQVNIRAGDLPAPAPNGISYLKIPLDVL